MLGCYHWFIHTVTCFFLSLSRWVFLNDWLTSWTFFHNHVISLVWKSSIVRWQKRHPNAVLAIHPISGHKPLYFLANITIYSFSLYNIYIYQYWTTPAFILAESNHQPSSWQYQACPLHHRPFHRDTLFFFSMSLVAGGPLLVLLPLFWLHS